MMTAEGVKGVEHLKWSDATGPEHNVTLPFTRMGWGLWTTPRARWSTLVPAK
jgi:hypothetical protein